MVIPYAYTCMVCTIRVWYRTVAPIKSQYLFKLNYCDENRVNYVTLHVIMAAADEDVERAGYKVAIFLV